MNLRTTNMTRVPYWNDKECTAIYGLVFWDFSSLIYLHQIKQNIFFKLF